MPLNHHFPMVFLWFSTKSIQFQCPFRSSAWPKNSASRLGAIWIVLAPGGPGGTGPHTKQPEVWNHTLCIENSVKLWIDINDMYVFIHKAMYVFIYVCIHIIYRRYIYIHTSSYIIYTHHIGLSQNEGYPKINNFKLKNDTNHGT